MLKSAIKSELTFSYTHILHCKYYIKLEKKTQACIYWYEKKIDIQYHPCNNLFPYLAEGAEKTKRVCKISFEFFACSVLFYF